MQFDLQKFAFYACFGNTSYCYCISLKIKVSVGNLIFNFSQKQYVKTDETCVHQSHFCWKQKSTPPVNTIYLK